MYVRMLTDRFSQWCLVLLDEAPVKHCLAANEEEGYVDVYREGPDGHWIQEGLGFARERRYGQVRITLFHTAPAPVRKEYQEARQGPQEPLIL